MTTPQNTASKCPASGRSVAGCVDQTHATCGIGITQGIAVDRYQDFEAVDHSAPTLENYRRLTRQGAGPAAAAMFAQLPTDTQAAIRAENLRARGIIDHGSRFD